MSKPLFFVNRFGDRYLHDVNRGAFERLGATAIFEQHFGKSLFREDTLHIFIGTDSGLLIRHVLGKGVPEGSRYLFMELDSLLPTIRDELEQLELGDSVHLIGQHELRNVLDEIRLTDYANIGAIAVRDSLASLDSYVAEYRLASSEIRQELDGILWVYNSQLSNPTFIRAQLRNLIEEHVPAEVLRDSMSGGTAVLLGGGPSLDNMIPWVRKHRNDVVVIAVSRVCRRLRDAGITPHIVVSIDPTELSFDISKELLLLDPDVIFAHANHVYFQLLAQWRGRSVYLDALYPWDAASAARNLKSVGPTVTNTAFALAHMMGFRRIVFGGIDLCHSAEGFTHARGSNEHEAGPRLGTSGMRVRTNSGTEAETTPDFHNAIQSLGGQASRAREADIRVINPAPGAAAIAGVEHVALDAVDVAPQHDDLFRILHAVLPKDSQAMRIRNLSSMQKELTRCNGRLRQVVRLAEEALECNDGLFGRNGKTADFKYKKRMDKIERQLDSRLRDVSEIVKLFSARAFLHMPPSDREWTDDEIEQAGKTYYTAYLENANEVLELLEEAQQRIRVAIAEESEPADLQKLLEQWEKDDIPGRAGVWCHRHPVAASELPDAISSRFFEMQQEFDRIIETRETPHLAKVRSEAELGPVRSRLQLLFNERNGGQLARIAEQLHKQQGGEARQLEQLARGYLSEIQDQPDTAFAQYAELIELVREELDGGAPDEPNPRLEDGLRRMVVIAMDQEWFDQAQLILGTLAQLAPTYQPQYAELLRLSGDTEGAVEVYTQYLGRAPGDLATMLRLGRLYQSMGAADAARTAFNYVLENEPDNQTARTLLEQIETAA